MTTNDRARHGMACVGVGLAVAASLMLVLVVPVQVFFRSFGVSVAILRGVCVLLFVLLNVSVFCLRDPWEGPRNWCHTLVGSCAGLEQFNLTCWRRCNLFSSYYLSVSRWNYSLLATFAVLFNRRTTHQPLLPGRSVSRSR